MPDGTSRSTHTPAAGGTTFGGTLAAMAGMGWPIMLGSVSMALLNLGQVALLGHAGEPHGLYLLSRLQPYFLLFFAVLEALAITGQVFSARSRRNWPRRRALDAALLLSLLGVLVVGALAGAAALARGHLLPGWLMLDAATLRVLPLYLMSLLPLLVFEVLNGALRGQGRTLPGFVTLALGVALNLGLSYHLVIRGHGGIDGILIANAASGIAMLPVMAALLAFELRGAERGPAAQALVRLGSLLAAIGAPVFLSLVVSFFSSAVLVELVAAYGPHQASSFLIVLRIRLFFLIPAIALATALAVLVNQERDDAGGSRHARLRHGALVISLLYLALTAGLYAVRVPLLGLMTDDLLVRSAALAILGILLPSFALVGLAVGFQIVLENLGRGARVLAWTVALEVATCAALAWWARDVAGALTVLLAAAGAYTLAFGIEYALLFHRRQPEASGSPPGEADPAPAA